MGVGVASGLKNGSHALLGHGREPVRLPRRTDGVDCNLHVTTGAIFKTDRHREARSELSVDLAFGGTCAYGRPGDGVGYKLRDDGVEKLGTRGETDFTDIDQQFTRNA